MSRQRSLGARVERSTKISEATAMRRLHYRNGFKLIYRCCCYSPAYQRREGSGCPWWAYPRCRAVSLPMYRRLVARLNEMRA